MLTCLLHNTRGVVRTVAGRPPSILCPLGHRLRGLLPTDPPAEQPRERYRVIGWRVALGEPSDHRLVVREQDAAVLQQRAILAELRAAYQLLVPHDDLTAHGPGEAGAGVRSGGVPGRGQLGRDAK